MDTEDVTRLLKQAGKGDRASLDRVFEIIYPELKRLARGRIGANGGTLTPTALVNETYEKFVNGRSMSLQGRAHFLACAAKAMRQIVVDLARRSNASKRGGDWLQVTFTEDIPQQADRFLDLEAAMGDLQVVDPELTQLVELKYFGGLELTELAELLGISRRKVSRDWEKARAFLHARMSEAQSENE